MKKIILSVICAFTLLSSNAAINKHCRLKSLQGFTSYRNTIFVNDTLSFTKEYRAISPGLSFGTQGIGIESQISIFMDWKLRAGFTVLPFQSSNDFLSFPSRSVVAKLNANFSKFHVIADWVPFPFLSSPILKRMVLSGGLSYFLSAKGTAVMKLKDPYYYGDIELSQDEVGELRVVSNWKGFAPYVGIGLNQLKIANRVNLNIATGVFYMPSPAAQITGTNLLSENSHNQQQLEYNLNKYYRWMPSLQLTFNYSIKY